MRLHIAFETQTLYFQMKGCRDHDEPRDLLLKLMIIIVQMSTRTMKEFANDYFLLTHIALCGVWS